MSPVATLMSPLTGGGRALRPSSCKAGVAIGTTQYNAGSASDFFRKDTDEFSTRLVKRATPSARACSCTYVGPGRQRAGNPRPDARPRAWLGDGQREGSAPTSADGQGWLEDWSATVIRPNEVSMNIDVQG